MKNYVMIFKGGEKIECKASDVLIAMIIAQTKRILENKTPEIIEILELTK